MKPIFLIFTVVFTLLVPHLSLSDTLRGLKAYRVLSYVDCGVNYTEGLIKENHKECLNISKLTEEYRIHSQGKCAAGYIKVLRPNDKNHKDYCERK